MRVEVSIGDWEHDCCGDEIERYQRVRWSCIVDSDGLLAETHHDLEGLEITEVAGTVVDVHLVKPDGTRVSITRIPSGRALRGFDKNDNGAVLERYTDEPQDASIHDFIVTLELDS